MKLYRDMLRGVQGYTPGEQVNAPNVIKLNTNENPYPCSPKVFEALAAVGEGALRKYPDPVSTALREACAQRYGYPSAQWVVAGNGMDELLAMALRTFVDPGDAVLSPFPTYTLYETLSALHGATFTTIDLDADFQLPTEFFEQNARMCFFPRPNAPSGVCTPREEVERLCEGFDGIVVIDEAYADFADDTCIDFPKRFDNVIVMRTFSKAYSLAGVRLGIAVAQPALIDEFLKTKDSYNLGAFTQAAGLAAIDDYAHMQSNVQKIRTTRARLTKALEAMGFQVPESQSNFVLARWQGAPSAREILEALRAQNILVRYFDVPRLQDSLRISVGTDEETDRLLSALESILNR